METEREEKMEVFEATILHHVCIVLCLLWLVSWFNCGHPAFYFVSLVYLYLVHERYEMRLRKKLQFEEKMQSNQRRVLTDSESVRWLNYAIEKIWPVCMEQIVSQKILLPIIPWFLDKYKPWTVRKSVVEYLYMGRSPPMFTEMRVLRQTTGDDHLVLELGMNFRTADDMSAILAVKLARRVGFGMWAKLHLKGLHVEGKVLIGIKFIRHWPFLGRVRLCFVEPPYFQMIVKPIFTHGLDVTEVPGIAGWLDKLLALAFEQTLVEPNMLVVDVEKFASPQPENWFCIDEKESIAYALVEVIEGADMKPSDLNGLADPYVKGQLGPYRFRTKTQWKTLAPKWHEEFKVPICTWDSPNVLAIEVRDKDQFRDDSLGDCSVNISDLRGGQRHDLWLSLRNIKMGRLHLAITVVEGKKAVRDLPCDNGILNDNNKSKSMENESTKKGSISSGSLEKSHKLADKFEPIDIEGQKETGIWVHHPGSEVSQIWEPRKGRTRVLDSQVLGNSANLELPSASMSGNNDNISTDGGTQEGKKGTRRNKVLRGLKKIGTVFSKNSKKEDMSCGIEGPIPSPHPNLMAINERKSRVKLIVEEDNLSAPSLVNIPISEGKVGSEGSSQESPSKRDVKDITKSIVKNAGKSAHGVKHALDRKGPKKSQGDLELVVTNKDISAGSESSDEESPASSVCTSEGNPVIPKALSSSGNDSFKSEELRDRNTPFDFPITKDSSDGTEKISCAWPGDKKTGDDYPSIMMEESDDLLNYIIKR